MSNYPFPVKNTAYIFYVGLIDQSNTKVLKANPTLASGDFQVSIDGGAFANLGTLPTVTPAAGTSVKISMASGEMNGDNIVVACIDTDSQWCDQFINIQTATRGIDDLAFPTTSGRSIDVAATGEVGLDFTNRLDTTGILPNVVAGGNGGLFIAGSNAATSITTALTANLIGNITGNLSGSVGSVTGAVGSVTGNVGGTVASVTGNVGGNVTGSVGSVVGAVGSVTAGVTVTTNNDKSAYALSSVGLDNILMSDITAVPAITGTLKQAINWFYILCRNRRWTTATTETIYKDDGTTPVATAVKSDDATTYKRDKYS